MTASPYFGDYGINSRLRESGHTLYAEALIAQSEAIKRNRVVRRGDQHRHGAGDRPQRPGRPVVLRTPHLADGVRAATAVVDFGSQGWPGGPDRRRDRPVAQHRDLLGRHAAARGCASKPAARSGCAATSWRAAHAQLMTAAAPARHRACSTR